MRHAIHDEVRRARPDQQHPEGGAIFVLTCSGIEQSSNLQRFIFL